MSEEDLEIVFTEENDNSVVEKPEKIKGPEFEPVITDSKNADAVLRENGISYEMLLYKRK